MNRRRPNPRLAKIHRSYGVDEIARLYGVHRNTVRHWIKQGLPTSDNKRPTLILGRDLAAFLQGRRARNKRPCGPGQLYCMRCRIPQAAAGGLAEYQPLTPTVGNLLAMCPACETLMYRRVTFAKLRSISGDLEISMPQGRPHIADSPEPSVNSDFNAEAAIHDNAQSR